MEPGGIPDQESYDSWFRLGATELIDCKAHHLDWNALVGRQVSRWHQSTKPPTQPTWRSLIQLLLAYLGRPADLEEVREYQREMWGMSHGETAVIELSALRATTLDVEVDRERHRAYRIDHIRARMLQYRPKFVLFYGLMYRKFYERIAGGVFNRAGFRWSDGTLCVLARHPAPRRSVVTESWIHLGKLMSSIVDAGQESGLPPELTRSFNSTSVSTALNPSQRSEVVVVENVVSISRNGEQVGRIAFDGRTVRVERRNSATREFESIGLYEAATHSTFRRKVNEIKCVFPKWAALVEPNLADIKVSWRKRERVPNFSPAEGENKSGCSVVELAGDEIARIYKSSGDRAVWVKLGQR